MYNISRMEYSRIISKMVKIDDYMIRSENIIEDMDKWMTSNVHNTGQQNNLKNKKMKKISI